MKIKSFFFQALHTLLSKGVLLIFGIVSSIFTARFLGPQNRGVLTIFLTLPAIISPFLNFGIKQSTAYIIGQEKYKVEDVSSAVLICFFIASFLGWVIILGCYYKMGLIASYGIVISLFFLSMFPSQLFREYMSGFFLGRKQVDRMNVCDIVSAASLVCFLALTLKYLKLGLLGASLSYFLSQIFVIPLIFFYNRNSFQPPLRIQWNNLVIKELLSKGFLFAITLFILQLNYRVDVLLLGKLQSDYSVGIYSVGVNLVELIKQISISVGVVLFSYSANWKEEMLNTTLQKVSLLSRILFACVLIIALIIFVFAKYLILFLYGAPFEESAAVVQLLLPGIVMLTVFSILQLFVAGQGKPHIPLFAFLPGLVLNVLLNLYMIPRWDYVGAAISSSISYTFATVIYLLVFNRLYGTKIKELFLLRGNDIQIILNYLK